MEKKDITEEPKKESGKKSKNQPVQYQKVTHKRISPTIKCAAECLLQNLLRFVGNYPNAAGNATVSTLANEEDLLMDIHQRNLEDGGIFAPLFLPQWC